MAGDWIKVEIATPDKPEVWDIAEKLGIDPDAVFGKVFRVWAWFDAHTESGNAPSVTKTLLDRKVGVTGFVNSMIGVGWMLESDGTLSMPNFDHHNGESAKKRANTARRVSKHRKCNAPSVTGGNAPSVTVSVTSALAREEKSREEIKTIVEKVIKHLNDVAGRSFRPTESNAKHIRARLGEGYTLDNLIAVTDAKCKEWKGDKDREQYLRPATLFNAEKFNQYVGQVGASNARRERW